MRAHAVSNVLGIERGAAEPARRQRGGMSFTMTEPKPGGASMPKIKKVGHVVLGVRDPQKSIKFYTEALGMELVNVLEEMQMAFFSFGERDHDIAVIKVPDDQPVGSSGLAHTA